MKKVEAKDQKDIDPKYTPVAVNFCLTKLMMNWNEVIKKENKNSNLYETYTLHPRTCTFRLTQWMFLPKNQTWWLEIQKSSKRLKKKEPKIPK